MTSTLTRTLIVSACSTLACLTAPSVAQTTDDATARQETVFVTGSRQAYKGNFAPLEIPAADQTIDEALLTSAG
ncbi:MAG: hypothetical protein AAF253_07295, partial [Pseudomonadota bacterium]